MWSLIRSHKLLIRVDYLAINYNIKLRSDDKSTLKFTRTKSPRSYGHRLGFGHHSPLHIRRFEYWKFGWVNCNSCDRSWPNYASSKLVSYLWDWLKLDEFRINNSSLTHVTSQSCTAHHDPFNWARSSCIQGATDNLWNCINCNQLFELGWLSVCTSSL